MNNILEKSVQNNRKQSANCSSDVSKVTNHSKETSIESEVYARLNRICNTIDRSLMQTKVNEHLEQSEASILIDVNKRKMQFNTKELVQYERAMTRRNFMRILMEDDFSDLFELKESKEDKGIKGDDEVMNGSYYHDISNSDSFGLKQSCLIPQDYKSYIAIGSDLSFNPPLITIANNKEIRNETRMDSYEEVSSIPLYISHKRGIPFNDTNFNKEAQVVISAKVKDNDKTISKDKPKSKKKVKILLIDHINELKEDLDANDTLDITNKKTKETIASINIIPERLFPCEICNATFTSPQGLGGHMSRTHKDQSLKFKKKKEIRDSRAPIRDQREVAKRILCEENNMNYDLLINSKEGKRTIKKLITLNMKQFKLIRDQLPRKGN